MTLQQEMVLRSGAAMPAPAVDAVRRRMKPVMWWAACGVASMAIFVYVFTAWILSDDFARTDPGPSPLPGYMRFFITVEQVGVVAGCLVICYLFLYRPWRRNGSITLDGMILISLVSLYWQDPYMSFMRGVFTYNAHMFNMGSWANFLPFFSAPNYEKLAEPLLWEPFLYITFCFPLMLLLNRFMNWAQARWPRMGRAGVVGLVVGAVALVDVVIEPIFMLQGLYAYPGTVPELTLFRGHYFQYPVYYALFTGLWIALYPSLRHFRDDKGLTFAERGIDEVRAGPRQKTWLRVLAMIGISNVAFLVLFNIPLGVINGLSGDTWPKDITDRSYLVNEICGPGTDYACPSRENPLPLRGSGYFDPDGNYRKAQP